MIFSASLSESDDFVLFDLLDGNSGLFASVLRDVTILCIIVDGNMAIEHLI